MRICFQKPVECDDFAAERSRCWSVRRRRCAIFALLIGLVLCDLATACPQFGGGGYGNLGDGNQKPVAVGTAGTAVRTSNSVSQAALRAEAILRQPPTGELRNADKITDAIDALQAMGLDVILTDSATDDCLVRDEPWEIIGNPNETVAVLDRYLKSRNAVFSVTQKGAVKIISMDEMLDEQYFQTLIYRVDNLVSDDVELKALAVQIQETLFAEDWAYNGGSATIQPRNQSGHRLLLVTNHYQRQVRLRQFFNELSAAGSGRSGVLSQSKKARVGVAHETMSRLVDVPDASDQRSQSSGPMVLGVPETVQSGGVF